MPRRAKPAKAEVEARRPVARKSPTNEASKRRGLEKRLAESLEREKATGALLQEKNRALTEALDQQTATTDILRVIPQSPTDVQPVFDMIAESAARLCEAQYCFVYRFEGQLLHFVAHHGLTAEVLEINRSAYPAPPGRRSVAARAVLERSVVQIPDVNADPDYALGAMAATGGYRSAAAVPILRDGLPIGSIAVTRAHAGLLPDRQIDLLKTFADQAVIAIENARLFTELEAKNRALTQAHAQVSESLEQKTATSEILRVLSGSPTDTQPVFEAIVTSAARLCDAAFSAVFRFDGELLQIAALNRVSPEETEVFHRVWPRIPRRDSIVGRTFLEGREVHVEDVLAEADYGAQGRELQRMVRYRTLLGIPMLREGVPIGVICCGRRGVQPFTQTQVELLRTFADQAVIAIENVRLFTELQTSNRDLTTALDQQTATSDILRVISQSQTDVQPVFDAIVVSAVRLLGAYSGSLSRIAGDQIELAALTSTDDAGNATLRALFPQSLHSEVPHAQAIRACAPVTIADAYTDPRVPEASRANARIRGYRSLVVVPLLRHDEALGAISVTRREAGGFTDDEIALLKTFADQAVIAIENVRLFKELEARNRDLTVALEQQTATADILRVISRSQTDVQPVFDAIIRSAVRLCTARFGSVSRFDGEMLHIVAHHNFPPDALEALQRLYPMRPSHAQATGRAILSRAVAHLPDLLEDREYQREYAPASGFRSILAVPMLREGTPIGVIVINRYEPGPFADTHIELLKIFADQAVIAIENVRLFKELEGRNRDLTATGEILRVIASSPTDLQPIFDTIADRSMQLCEAVFGWVMTFDGQRIYLRSLANVSPEGVEALRRNFPLPPSRGFAAGRTILTGEVVEIRDVLADPEYDVKETAQVAKYRSILTVPLLHQGRPIGVIAVSRPEPGAFSEEQIQLLTTFADQAVIAIENVRLFTELQTSNRDLTTALDQQTATSDILRVISQSQTDVQPVFDAIVDSAVRLLRGNASTLSRIEGDQIALAAMTSTDDPGDASQRARFPMSIHSEEDHAQAVRNRVPLHSTDAHSDPRLPETQHASARLRGYRSLVVVPLVRHDEAVGALGVARREPGGFTDDEIALLKTFADQAVIAIENVRLFNELEGRNRDLTATAEILRVISSSPTDVQPVFDTIVRSAVQLCDGLFGTVLQFDGELLHFVAQHNHTPQAVEEVRRVYPARPTRALGATRAILDRAVVHIPDVEVDPEYEHHAISRAIGFRSGLFVPMLREGAPIGVIMVARAEVGPFSDNEIELLKTFADQAVIAVENVRLFKELQARTGELTQSVEKLTALGEVSRAVSSTLDVETVLNTIVSRASQLAGAAGCSIYEYDEGTEQFELRATHHDDPAFVEALRAASLRKGEGLMGRAAEMREPIQIPDITQPGAYQSSVRDTLIRFGYRALLAVPLLREDQIIGSLSLTRKEPGEYAAEVIDVLKSFATQSALAIQNARLFREIADKSAQLEAASRHKSEFLANMSHELRTPLNAIIGFSEVLVDRMFGELNEKQDEYLKDIYASGQHLLSLINDILDLSKIEAGRMELELADFDLPSAIDNALTLVRERASRRGITLGRGIDEHLGRLRGDERKVKQVLLNLLSNALKFTPEGGRIDVSARMHDGVAEIAVTDTGVGIAPEDQEAVFEEFRQVGTADKKVEGTGLGLALSRKFIELHGGRIWVKSQVGVGSTFTFTLPVRPED